MSGANAIEHPVELWRRRIGLVLAPLVFVALWSAPLALPLPAHRLAAILGAVVVLWMSEAVPMTMTALLGVSLAVVLGVAPAAQAFAPFADPIMFLFIGSFILARAIFFHGLDRRFALALLTLPGVGPRPGRVLAALAVATFGLSMWISNTATVAMMLPIGLSLLHVLEAERPAPAFAAALLFCISLAASFGGLGTPVGTPPNLIGIGLIRREAGVDIPFFGWMMIGVPAGVAMLAIAVTWFTRRGERLPPDPELEDELRAERRALGPWTRGQRNTALAFAVTVALWVIPGWWRSPGAPATRSIGTLQETVPESVAALLGASLLFILPVDLRRMEFTLAVGRGGPDRLVDRHPLRRRHRARHAGVPDRTRRGDRARPHQPPRGARQLPLLCFSTALAALLSETTSNTASANMVVPVVIAVARAADVDPCCRRWAPRWAHRSASCCRCPRRATPWSTPRGAFPSPR